jgi:hypothetical protein
MCDTPEYRSSEHESIRIRQHKEKIERCTIETNPTTDTKCCSTKSTNRIPPSEHVATLVGVSTCNVYTRNIQRGSFCTSLVANSSDGGPYALNINRSMPRISRMQDNITVAKGVSSSTTTRQRNDSVLSSTRLIANRYSDYFRPQIPPPPCPYPPSRGGIPIAPQTICNLGTQRIDFVPPNH